jgi:hypothetical protein
MKLSKLLFVLFLLLIVSAIPSQAQEPLVLYDDFESEFLDGAKWYGRDTLTPGMTILETVREIDRTQVHKRLKPWGDELSCFAPGRLRLALRTYGTDSSATARLQFAQPENIRTIQVTLEVQDVHATGCANNSAVFTKSRVRIMGFFFNTQEPTPVDDLNAVYAQIDVCRRSNSSDPSGVMEVRGAVTHVLETGTADLGSVTLGTIKLGQKVRLRITWDPDNDRFIFRKGVDPEVYVTYTVPDGHPPYYPNKRLEILEQVPICTDLPRPLAHMDVLFDNVLVNESAVP